MKLHVPSSVTILKWIFCLFTALSVALVAFGMSLAISFSYHTREVLIGKMADNATLAGAFLLYGSFNTICAAVSCLCVVYGASRASGSGLPELVTMLNGVDVPGFLTARTFCMKVIGAVAAVAASLPLGYQGVMLHIGGMLASLLASHLPHFELTAGAKRSPGTERRLGHCMTMVKSSSDFNEYDGSQLLPETKWHRRLPKILDVVTDGLKRRRRSRSVAAEVGRVHFIAATHIADQVACGAAAGVSAAFKAPIGGMLYLMELSTRWRLELTWRTFFSTSVTALALSGVGRACGRLHFCSSAQAFLSVSGGPYEYRFTEPYSQLPIITLFAALMGVTGAAFVSLNAATVKLRNRWSHSRVLLLLEVILFTLLYSAALIFLAAWGTCHPCDPSSATECAPGALHNKLKAMGCGPHEYNDLASLVMSPNGLAIRSLWSMRYEDFSAASLALFVPVYFLAAAWTSGLAIPSGSFSPTILLGSACGRLFAHALKATALVSHPDAELYSFLGAAALFTGQTRMTVSLCVIMLEMVGVERVLPFLMVTIIVAKGVADRLGDSIILRRIKLKNLPFVRRMPHKSLRRSGVTAMHIVRQGDHPMLPDKVSGHKIQQMLSDYPDKQLFVVIRHLDPDVPRLTLTGAGGADRSVTDLRPSATSGSVAPLLRPSVPHSSSQVDSSICHCALVGIISRSALHARLQLWEDLAPGSQESRTVSESDCGLATPRRGGSWASMPVSRTPSSAVEELLEGQMALYPSAAEGVDGSGPQLTHCMVPTSAAELDLSAIDCHGGAGVCDDKAVHCHASQRPSLLVDGFERSSDFGFASNLGAVFDLATAAQVPPIMLAPHVGLEAIFAVMNNMAVELVAIVSPNGGLYYGLLTRHCIQRFQKAQDSA